MPIMTLNDRLVLISSHMESITRAMKRGDYDAVSGFLDAISSAAGEGREQAAAMAEPPDGPNLSPAP